jgi:hypothetical protein
MSTTASAATNGQEVFHEDPGQGGHPSDQQRDEAGL